MIAPVQPSYGGQLIELGAGNGAVTVRLAERCPRASILAFEINPVLAEDNRRRLARTGLSRRVEVITASAHCLGAEMERRGMRWADYILSGLPLGSLPRAQARGLLDLISATLRVGGLYIQFQHSFLSRDKILARFPKTRAVPVLLNLPPAVVYYAEKPAGAVAESVAGVAGRAFR